VWQASARLVINHPDLDRAELARKIQHRWSGKGNVNVQLFNEHKSASDSAADIIGNSLQHLGQMAAALACRLPFLAIQAATRIAAARHLVAAAVNDFLALQR
jgi:hypothetical protein